MKALGLYGGWEQSGHTQGGMCGISQLFCACPQTSTGRQLRSTYSSGKRQTFDQGAKLLTEISDLCFIQMRKYMEKSEKTLYILDYNLVK